MNEYLIICDAILFGKFGILKDRGVTIPMFNKYLFHNIFKGSDEESSR